MSKATTRTTATVRIMLSYQYCNFEASMNLENEDGVTTAEIENARKECQQIVTDAVNDYKRTPNKNPSEELKLIEKKIADIKGSISEKPAEPVASEEEIAAVQKLPLYEPPAKKVVKETKAKKTIADKPVKTKITK